MLKGGCSFGRMIAWAERLSLQTFFLFQLRCESRRIIQRVLDAREMDIGPLRVLVVGGSAISRLGENPLAIGSREACR